VFNLLALKLTCFFLAAFAAFAMATGASAAEVEVQKMEHGARITINRAPFAEYLVKSGHQPVVWPIIGPGGQTMTHPLGTNPLIDKDDHPHHQSLWFNHGLVNGKDFWTEPPQDGPRKRDNQIVHREFAKIQSGDPARLVARNDWISDGESVCEDERTITFGADKHGRWIDFAVDVIATNGDIVFGDTKEGTFALRVPATMSVEANGGGRILNSHGQKDDQAWGRSAEWVDYHGHVDGKPAGIAVFDMPDSFRHPTRWHVRTYGLFAANPFGQQEFPPDDVKQGEVTLKKGDRLQLHYRVLFYSGSLTKEELFRLYSSYAKDLAGK
jgi:hypothetical protein